ncbi:MAG: aldolase/citrate lyase family protein [Candidatus Omnitrophota bacterium]
MIKEQMRNGKFVLGTWCELPSPAAINVMAKAGLDFVIIDMEHSVMDFKTAQEMVLAAEADGCDAIIRVCRNDESDILRALDTGAAGIIVPHIENVEDREKVVRYSKFAPKGDRGFNPYIRAGGYNSVGADYFQLQNEKVLVCIIVEGKEAMANLDEIICDSDIDVVYIGTYDLSVAFGVPGDVKNKKVTNALVNCVEKIIKAGKSAGCMVHNADDLRWFKQIGIQFIAYKADTAIIFDAFSSMKKEIS